MMTIQSRTPSLENCGLPAFTFAGFQFPRYLATLPCGSLHQRVEARRPGRAMCSDYYSAPTPNNREGRGFYLRSSDALGLRWQYADDIVSRLSSGYDCDGFYEGNTMRGIVLRLPRGRGFLAGWTMGEGMASSVDYSPIFDNPEDAAFCADSMAENAAFNEREYQESERERLNAEESESED